MGILDRSQFFPKANNLELLSSKGFGKNCATSPFGKTVSYLQMAKNLGDEKCIRAAGTANGKNNLVIIVPCHRVIGSNGNLVGFAGGLWRKQWKAMAVGTRSEAC